MRGYEAQADRNAQPRTRSALNALPARTARPRPVCPHGPAPTRLSRLFAACGLLALSLSLGACQTDGSGMAASGGRTLAFDTIDGPPPATFDKLVDQLSSEAETRRVAVVSRSSGAAYRVKGYLAMHVEKGKASVAYAWDVYDSSRTRVARVSGEEPAGPLKGGVANGWAACDDAVLSRIAGRSMASLAETLGVEAPVPARAAPAEASAPDAGKPAEAPAPVMEPGSGTPVAALSASGAALSYAQN